MNSAIKHFENCPFCPSTVEVHPTEGPLGIQFDSVHVYDGEHVSRVTCMRCDVCGPIFTAKTKDEAEEGARIRWNERKKNETRRTMTGYQKGYDQRHIGGHLELPSCQSDPACQEFIP